MTQLSWQWAGMPFWGEKGRDAGMLSDALTSLSLLALHVLLAHSPLSRWAGAHLVLLW